jgi:hypothetical protein
MGVDGHHVALLMSARSLPALVDALIPVLDVDGGLNDIGARTERH